MAIGQPVTRLEDMALVTGAGRFVADMSLPFQLHMRLVRSPVAHGRIVKIDATEALAMSGVVAVWTSHDVSDVPPVDFRDPSAEALLPYRQPVLARARVRYVGEPVAAVFAVDAYTAEDAADAVHLEIDPLPIVMSASEPPIEFDEGHTTEATVLRHGYGDVERAFAEAHTVVELDLEIGRHSAVPMETRGAIGTYDPAWTWCASMALRRCLIAIATPCRKCLDAARARCTCTSFMSAAASGSAASSIRKTCWCAWRRCGWAGQSNGSRTGGSI